jgi:hypothetical protein
LCVVYVVVSSWFASVRGFISGGIEVLKTDPKSGAPANSATFALFVFYYLLTIVFLLFLPVTD